MNRLNELVSEFGLVERALGDPAAMADNREYARLTRRHRELSPLVALVREREGLESDLAGARELLLAAVPEVLGETPLIAGRGEHFASLITQGVEGYLDFMEAKTSVTAMWHDLLRRAWQHLPWASKEDR